jgi:hypothetical protein
MVILSEYKISDQPSRGTGIRMKRYYFLEYIRYSTINVERGNNALKTIVVSVPMLVFCRMKNRIIARVIACRLANI